MQEKRQRLIVPDLARGTALLGIAMANAVQSWVVNEWSLGPSSTVGGVRPDNTPRHRGRSVYRHVCACARPADVLHAVGVRHWIN